MCRQTSREQSNWQIEYKHVRIDYQLRLDWHFLILILEEKILLLYSLAYQNLRRSFEAVPESFKDQISIQGSSWQTLDLAKILHCRIFRPKPLHRQFHLFSTVLAIKIQQKSENGEIYTVGKNFTLPPAVTGGTNFTYASRSPKCGFWFTYVLMSCVH